MQHAPGVAGQLSRRQFLHRAAMATAATAIASRAYGGGPRGSHGPKQTTPGLDVGARVNALAVAGERLVAVGGHLDHGAARPAVWTHRFGEASWSLSAGASDFPPHTVLTAVTAIGDTFVIAGQIHELSSVQTIVDDSSGRPVQLSVVASIPAIFRSPDGRRWEQVVRGVPGSALGAFGGVALVGGRVVAVGTRFLEPGISEGYGLIAMASVDGSTWERAELLGVTPPRHGTVTLLARLGDSTLLATRAIRDASLFISSGRTWRAIDAPTSHVSYTAAGQNERGLLLAGVDDSGTHRVWRRSGQRWREEDGLPGIPAGARLTDFVEVDGALVVSGARGGRGFVREIGR